MRHALMVLLFTACSLPDAALETTRLDGDAFDAQGLWLEEVVTRTDGTESSEHTLLLNSHGWSCDRFKTWRAFDPTAVREVLLANATDLESECEAWRQGYLAQAEADLSWWSGLWMEIGIVGDGVDPGSDTEIPWMRRVNYSWPALAAQHLDCRLAGPEGRDPFADAPSPEAAVDRDYSIEGSIQFDPHRRYVFTELDLDITNSTGAWSGVKGTARFDHCRLERSLD